MIYSFEKQVTIKFLKSNGAYVVLLEAFQIIIQIGAQLSNEEVSVEIICTTLIEILFFRSRTVFSNLFHIFTSYRIL